MENSTSTPANGYTASEGKIHTWAVGYIANYWMIMQLMMIGAVFTTDFKMQPWVVTTTLAVPRLIDIFVDPLIGHWSDNTHTSWGRRRPFLLGSAIIGAVAVFALWQMSPDWPTWGQSLYLGGVSTLLYMAYSTYEMCYYALGYELSEDYGGRSKVMAIKGVYHAIAGMCGGFFYSSVMLWGKGVGEFKFFGYSWTLTTPHAFGNNITSIRYHSLVLVALILLFGLAPVIFCRERYAQVNRKHVDLKEALLATVKCRPFVLLMVLQLTRTLGYSLYQAFSFFIGVFYICQGNKLEWSNIMGGYTGVVGVGFSFLLWPLAKPLTNKLGKRMGIILGYGAALAQACLFPFIFKPGNVDVLFWVAVAYLPFGAVMGLFSNSVMPDICDIDELHYGERREGLFQAVQSFFNKAESWIVMLSSGFLLSLAGFDSKLDMQTPDTLRNMLWMGLTPLIFFTAVAFIISWFLPFTPAYMAKIRAELSIKRESRAGMTA